jgi:Ca-activated chloride channel family protein
MARIRCGVRRSCRRFNAVNPSDQVADSRSRTPKVGQPLLAALLFLLLAESPSQAQSQQTPPIRVTVNRVSVGVTVTDPSGHFVEGLHREDFQIFDNDIEQPVTDFLSIEEPAQLLLLIESGPAVLFLSKNHLLAADALLTAIAPTDRVAIASYSKIPKLLLDFTPNKAQARIALDNINFSNDFADLNLSASLSAAIDWLAPLPGKKTIVLLSTGFDSSLPEDPQAIQRKLLTSDIRILAISLTADFRQPVKRKKPSAQDRANREIVQEGFAQADQSLRELSSLTGGRVYFPTNSQEFARAYAEIAQLIRHEYSLAFAPPADAQLHSLKVKTKNASYQVDHRQAYLAPSPNRGNSP